VRQLHAGGTALIVIEHNMRVIMGISRRVVALHLGQVIAVGSPTAATSDARVIEAYLGRAYAG
jgi:branched-chain amino acid transport system ATP-binding protein